MSDELNPQASIASEEFKMLLYDFAGEVEGAERFGDEDDLVKKKLQAIIVHIDTWAARLAADAAKDAERYRHLRGAQWFKAGFAKTEANASAFHYGGELLDSLVDAQIMGRPADAAEDA